MLNHIYPRKRNTNNKRKALVYTHVDNLFVSSSIVFKDILAMLNVGLFY